MYWNNKREITTESFYFTHGAHSNKSIFTPISSLEIQQEISIPSQGFDKIYVPVNKTEKKNGVENAENIQGK